MNTNTIRRAATHAVPIAVTAVLGMLIYSNTMTSSFQFDDRLNIVDNQLIRDISNFWPPSGGRWFGFLSFALNYAHGGLNPLGYHVVNTAIHILTAISVYAFVLLTLKTPFFCGHSSTVIPGKWIAVACSLLFIAHPIQTQAVTYIIQRFASLAALLFMLSINTYILARLSTGVSSPTTPPSQLKIRPVTVLLYAAAGLFGLLSLKTKENAYTLPVVILTYDVMFISSLTRLYAAARLRWRLITGLSVTAATVLAVVISRYGMQSILDSLKATNEISRYDYLITQFRVIITYIRLLFLPVGQTIDHNYKVYHSLFEGSLLVSLALIIMLAAAAFFLYRASRQDKPYLRLISFGILWFFITLSIESSLIPINDLMFEHRLYLPSIGVILAVTAACAFGLEKLKSGGTLALKSSAAVLIGVVTVLSCATYARNRVWKDELTLWTDVIAKDPGNPRGYNMVGNYYLANFRIIDAIGYFRKALEVDSTYAEARSNLGSAYLLAGRIDEGLRELIITEAFNRFDAIDKGILYYNIGKAYFLKGMSEQALHMLERALTLIPDEAALHHLLGQVYQSRNLIAQSSASFKKAHDLNPYKY